MALVVFLRGVNVGGRRRFRPSVVADQLRDYRVVNIGAAGTFVVRKPVSRALLLSVLRQRLPFETKVMICTGREVIAATSPMPFGDQPLTPNIVRFVSVLARRPMKLPQMPFRIPPGGKWLVSILDARGRFVFGFYRREMKAIGCLGAIDKHFGVPATTRNWNTIRQIVDVLEKK